ncbi:MAG: NAD(P)-binding protein [Candidatus Altiarchaeales archaeon]|nr:NAD(P)-binding protein [Candidatus Altiarchaeales archaeon]MBD3417246.1 NAD(P)-binding protein [Candidatus Altiarchaeales archaeon]
MDYEAIVVGAGVSGLLSALALSKEGKNVLVLERDGEVGGNLRTYEVDGWWVDTGLHAITHVDDGPLTKLMDDYFDVIPRFLPYGNYHIRTREKLVVFPWTMQAWVNFDVLPQNDRFQLMSILGASVASSIFGSVDKNQSVYDFLKNNRFSDKTWRFIDTFSYFMSGKNMRKTPVWRLMKGARYIQENESEFIGDKVVGGIANVAKLLAYDGSYHQAYPKLGAGAVTDCIVRSFPKGKVTVKTSEEVKALDCRDGKVVGVETDNDSYASDLTVYSGYMRDLPGLSGEFDEDFRESVGSLEQSTSITVWLGLDEVLPEFDYMGAEVWFEEGKSYWGMSTSRYNQSFAPEGKQLVGFTAIIEGGRESEEKALIESIYTAVPSAEDHVEFRHAQVTIPEKAAITVGSRFPGQKAPLDGLYLVGTDTDIRSMGVTRAAFSVVEMLKILKGEGRLT